jgi:hypothetical protein
MKPRPDMQAPRWRSAASAIADTLLVGGGWTLARRRGWLGAGAGRGRFVVISPDAIRAQLRTPGQRLLGLRTVDARSGDRVALWRTLVLVGAASAGRAIEQAAQPSPDLEEFGGWVREAGASHPADALAASPAPNHFNVPRAIGASLAVALVNSRLRRRLAPTREVLVRGPRAHRP